MLTALWRVFGTLLERAYSSEYKLMIQTVTDELIQKADDQHERLSKHIAELEAKNNDLRNKNKELQNLLEKS